MWGCKAVLFCAVVQSALSRVVFNLERERNRMNFWCYFQDKVAWCFMLCVVYAGKLNLVHVKLR